MALEVISENLDSQEVKNFIRGKEKTDELLHELFTRLQRLNNVYNDAEDKQLTNPAVRKWLSDFTEAIFDAEDLLDKIKTKSGSEILKRRMLEAADGSGSSTSTKVRQLYFPSYRAFYKSVDTKIEQIMKRLDRIAQRKDALELKTGARQRFSYTLPSTSVVKESSVYGRDEDKDTILKLLLVNDPLPWVCDSDDSDATGNKLDVIPIVGMAGIGKTTLAQLVYNDEKVTRHFDIRAWVCVSDDFDVVKITRTIYEKATSKANCDITDLDRLQVQLKKALTGKKFLFVLDDVWNKKYEKWDSLRRPFESGACGSKLIVTTRNESVASVMGTLQTHHIQYISDEDCWLLFKTHAFENENVGAYPKLEVIGRKIVEKCEGLPLAAKSLGGLLRSTMYWKNVEKREEEWKKVLESDIWELECDILPALWLSYRYLPPHLKRCFAYSSIYPKNYGFKTEELVLLWMAEDLVQPKKKKLVEEVGKDYFNDLYSRSFFQLGMDYDGRIVFTMHDLVNDLAKYVSGDFCVRLEDNDSFNIISKTRHFSYTEDENFNSKKIKALYGAKCMRTFLCLSNWIEELRDPPEMFGKVLPDLLSKLQCLRVLNLSYHPIMDLPDSVSKLIHLRYLDLSYTLIEELPDAVCGLYNLQSLLLTNCEYLAQLPTGLGRLIHLRHVDFRGTKLEKMPSEMCKLKYLQTLPFDKFVLDNENGHNIVDLRDLQELQGKLRISGLDKIVHAGDALEANMSEKKYLTELVLKWPWTRDTVDPRKDQEVLDNLQPHTNIRQVNIVSYGGTNFPAWLGDDRFSNLVSLYISRCPELESFPEGGLPCNLELLNISFCGKLVATRMQWGLLQLTSLRRLYIDFEKCEEEIDSFPEEGLLPTTLTHLEFGDLSNLKTINSKELKRLISLQSLKIENCPELLCLPDDGLPNSVIHLRIYKCPLVTQRCEEDKGEDWPKIARIPEAYIR